MKKIPLTKGKFAIVDDDDFDFINRWRWHLSDGGYANRSQYVRKGVGNYSSRTVRMHRVINNTPVGMFTDHINRDKLDNRKSNLRCSNKSLNEINKGEGRRNTSGRKGIYWDNWSNKWKAELMINRKKISLGRFANIKMR